MATKKRMMEPEEKTTNNRPRTRSRVAHDKAEQEKLRTRLYHDGSVYEGEWRNKKRHGQGRYKWPSGDEYVGTWDNGTMSGPGVMTWTTGDRYEGTWFQGQMNGQGLKTMASGDVYQGTWKNDKAHGYGEKTFKCGDHHAGWYQNDLRHGQGTYKWNNGDEYKGKWIDGKMKGFGTKKMADGSVYTGLWSNDMAQGQGRKIFGVLNGAEISYDDEGRPLACEYHEGGYHEDQRHGYGVYHWSSGDRYEGLWNLGQQEGLGSYYYADGSVYKGEWSQDLKHGPGIRLSNNEVREELWNKGVRVASLVRSRVLSSRDLRTENPVLSPEERAVLLSRATAAENEVLRLSVVQRPSAESSDDQTGDCQVCWTQQASSLLMPCRHLCVCQDCVKPLDTCPLCRTRISEVITVFRP